MMNQELNEYELAEGNEDLIGLRAKILPTGNYSKYVHGAVGVITVEHEKLFLKFDEPVFSSPHWSMHGSYLVAEGYVVV